MSAECTGPRSLGHTSWDHRPEQIPEGTFETVRASGTHDMNLYP